LWIICYEMYYGWVKRVLGRSVSLATRLLSAWWRCLVWVPNKGNQFFILNRVQTCYGALILWLLGILSPGVKRPEREVDRSLLSDAKITYTWSYTFSSPYVFVAWCVIKHRHHFTLNMEDFVETFCYNKLYTTYFGTELSCTVQFRNSSSEFLETVFILMNPAYRIGNVTEVDNKRSNQSFWYSE
jgi:hypothetical protein